MQKSEADRVVRSNDLESIYNITIEVLDDLVGGRDATKQRLEQIDFSASKFRLLSLSGIEDTKCMLRNKSLLTRLVKSTIGDHLSNTAMYLPHFLQYHIGGRGLPGPQICDT